MQENYMNQTFSAFQIKSKKILKNRLAVAPMTTQQSNAEGSISKFESDWLTRLSSDGYGMVISCAASISDTATAFYNQLSVAHDEFIPALQKVSSEMKKTGSINLIQLCHGGSRTIEALTGQKPLAVSKYNLPVYFTPPPHKEISINDIKQITNDFADACERVEKAGFDGVELHGANGYLFTQFISTMTNKRTDAYGGSLENRARFSREVVKACRSKVSENFIIGFRISFEGIGILNGLDIDENIQITNWLNDDGIDYIHSSQMHYAAKTSKYPKKLTVTYLRSNINPKLPLVIPGSITRIEDAENAIASGADIVALGRAAIGNKKVPLYFEQERELPFQAPFSESNLLETGVSRAMIDYLKTAPPLKSLNIVKQ